jgi:hypothetical protein
MSLNAPFRPAALALAVLSLAACATPPQASQPAPAVPPMSTASPASAPTAAPSAAARPDPSAPKPFAEVSKDAKRQDGFVPLWRKDEKVWLEIGPELIGKPLLFSANIAQSVGERGLYGNSMGPSWMVQFRRIGNQMQMVAKQFDFRGERDPATVEALRQGFSDSLLAGVPVASAEHPERKSVLVDASFLLGDLAGYSTRLERAYRLPFAVDRANSFFESARAEAGLTTLSAKVHYAVARIPAPPLLPPGAPAPLTPPPPKTTPDARSLFIGYVFNLQALPEQPMEVRRADPRVGYFTETYVDLAEERRTNQRVHMVNRWRLEKKDPAAALSEPVKPITFWLDKNIPQRYRASIAAGVLEWNKAFERIGFKNAVAVRQQSESDSFDTMDGSHASIRWSLGADVGFASGPSRVDPRTGEILDADISMSDAFARSARRLVRDDLGGMPSGAPLGGGEVPAWRAGQRALFGQEACTFAAESANELGFALDLMEARGDVEPDSPEAEALAQAYVKAVITHEVGHTLGLRHNFKASSTITAAQLRDPAFVAAHGTSGSVMDYNPFNLSLQGEAKPGAAVMPSLGAYDYWAIEYGYKPLAAVDAPQQLLAIAERSRSDKALVFADDGDAFSFATGSEGLDPLVNLFDQGDDPLAYAQRRLALSKELWERVQKRPAKAGDEPERARRSVIAGFNQLGSLPALAAKYVGGMHVNHDLPGSGQPSYSPVEPALQRRALHFLTVELFSNDSFRFKPEFLATLAGDSIEWERPGPVSVPRAVLALQTQALDRLLSPGTASRLLELNSFLPEAQRKGAISLNEVYTTLQGAVWSELKTGKDIDSLRRSLQREHLRRLQALLTRPSPGLPADAVSLARLNAVALQGQLKAAVGKPGLSVEAKAHLDDALALITEALRATLQRS